MISDSNQDDSLLEMFVFETTQNTQQLEQIILETEGEGRFSEKSVNEVFRIMHTIKGSAAMMSFSSISKLAHKVEDFFFFVRENISIAYDTHTVSDLLLSCMDYINLELENIRNGAKMEKSGCEPLIARIEDLLSSIKSGTLKTEKSNIPAPVTGPGMYKAVFLFEEGCEMENIRSYAITLEIAEYAHNITYEPKDIIDNDDSAKQIRENGFIVYFQTDKPYDEVLAKLTQTVFLRDLELTQVSSQVEEPAAQAGTEQERPEKASQQVPQQAPQQASQQVNAETEISSAAQYHQQPQSIISINVTKLDMLMDFMGEMVIAKTMVVENPELKDLELENFRKAAAHLSKIVSEMQELVMSMRLVPLSATFHKMHRIVRDMSKSLGKDVRLKLVGEETDVDKNIIEHISDPLIHLVRNCIDHGIETPDERAHMDKPATATVTLEAENVGGNVLVTVRDDGRGLNKEKILKKARQNNLLRKPENELTDREIYNLIFLPGFSTKDSVSEFSGRGVGMDVVLQNISAIGGSVSVDSEPGKGSAVSMKIPLTIAILDGMNVSVGDMRLTVPISAICESFKPRSEDVLSDTQGNEMIMVRGECYAIFRLHRQWGIETDVTNLTDGILMMVEQDGKKRCLFVDKMIGRQQVVVKALPNYVKRTNLFSCLSGCTLLGDGSISLILDPGWLVETDIVNN